MKILAFSKYSYEGPSSRYRFYNYQKCFQENGIEVTIKPLFSKTYFQASNKVQKIMIVLWSYLKRFAIVLNLLVFKKFDLILIEYEIFPFFPPVFEYLLKNRGIKYIVDYDDAIFHKYDMHKNKIVQAFLKNKIARVIQYADQVIVCNAYLEIYAHKYNQRTFRLPTVVLMENYKKKMDSFQKKEYDTFVIGWIGSRTTSTYILDIMPVMKKIVAKYPNIRFDLVGFDKTLLTQKQIDDTHINVITWTEVDEINNILAFDIGIMPLDNTPWSKGKCGFKLIQYMSCKKPVVASPVGVNVDIVKEDVNGFLVNSESEWFTAFEKLYLDKDMREKMAINNFHKIKTEYNNVINCKKYSELIKSTIDIKKGKDC